jgi:threonine dehydratase
MSNFPDNYRDMKTPFDPQPGHRIRLHAIVEALTIIDPVFLNSPQYECEPLSDTIGCDVTLKLETANPIRSFKGRGGSFLVASRHRSGAFDGRRVVGASAGNWGQALAYACRAIGQPITMFASVNASPLKIEMMRKLGAEMVLKGEDFDAAKLAARTFAQETGGVQLEDGFDVEASEGAATIAVELMGVAKPPDVVLVPLGNGAMLTGMARWIKAVRPETLVIGVQSRGADAMEKSWRGNTIIEATSVNTIADGIGVRIPVSEALVDMRGLVDDVVLVDDSSIITAMKLLYTKAGLLVEPSGAAGVAAILENKSRFQGLRLAAPICGGNVTDAQVRQYIFS